MILLINALSARQGGGQTYLRNLLGHPLPPEIRKVYLLLAENLVLETAFEDRVERLAIRAPVRNPFVRAAWEALVLPRILRRLRVDVLFCPGGVVSTRPPKGCKVVTMFRNMIPFDLEQRRRMPLGYQRVRNWLLERTMLRSMIDADLVIFISDFARRLIEERARGRLHARVVIPHGVNRRFLADGPVAQDALPEWLRGRRYLLYVSTLDFYKAQREVVKGYALARERAGLTETLVLVGPENPAYAALVRDDIATLGLEPHVIVAGNVPYASLPAVYRAATVNLFASESENCPNILLEALAAGRPILCSNRPPMPEFGGDAVVYFDPASPEQLADGLVRLLADETRMQALAAAGRARASRYDWGLATAATWAALTALAPSPRGAAVPT